MSRTREMVQANRSWLRLAARTGYAARGLVFLIIGAFAFRAAFASGRAMDAKDAVQVVAGSPFGVAALVVLVFALFSFAVWRVLQVVFDIDDHGWDAKGVFVRTGLAVSAVTYGALALYALHVLTGLGSSGGGGSGVVAKAYETGYGVWLTYAAAACMLAAAIAHLVKGAKAGFQKYMHFPRKLDDVLPPVCRIGLVARGLTFVVIAGLLVKGAYGYGAGDTPGLQAALSAMASWSYGWLLLSATGIGLLAFGIYGFAEAAFRRIEIEEVA